MEWVMMSGRKLNCVKVLARTGNGRQHLASRELGHDRLSPPLTGAAASAVVNPVLEDVMSIVDLDSWRGRLHGAYRDWRLRWDLVKAKRTGPPDAIWQAPLIFIHIPKSAGSSILKLGVARTRGHQTYAFYEKWAQGREIPPTFAVTRDPYTRYLSAYRYLKNGGGNGVDRVWANRNLHGDHNTFATEHLHRPEVQNWMHFRPQAEFLSGDHGAVSHILRLEALKDEWAPFARQYRLPETLPHINTTRGKEELSPAARQAIRRVYADDFDQIGY